MSCGSDSNKPSRTYVMPDHDVEALVREWNDGYRERGPYVVGQALADALEAEHALANDWRAEFAEERAARLRADERVKVLEEALRQLGEAETSGAISRITYNVLHPEEQA
jgi:hypothetical protein